MQIAIHGCNGYTKRMPELARDLGVSVRQVDAFAPDFRERMEGVDAFIWSLNHENKRDMEFGRKILSAYENAGVRVFPDYSTSWHYDDKASQAHFLAQLPFPSAKTWVFYSKHEALTFLESCSYPLIFKLRKGASSVNVKKIRDKREGCRIVNRMFGRGINPYPPLSGISRGISSSRKNNKTKDALPIRARRALGLWIEKQLRQEKERGYVLLQEFIPGNIKDTRVTVIGQRAFCFERMAKKNDFRVSGSGVKRYLQEEEIPGDILKIAFEISIRFKYQVMSYDFIRRPESGEPVLLEMSFSSRPDSIEECHGYMTPDMKWVSGHFRPEPFILQDLLGMNA